MGKEAFPKEGIVPLLTQAVCERSYNVDSITFGTGSGFGAPSSNHFPDFSKSNQNNIHEVIIPVSPLGMFLAFFFFFLNWFQHVISRSLLSILNTFNFN